MWLYEKQVAGLWITGEPKWDLSICVAMATCSATIFTRFLLPQWNEHDVNFDGFFWGVVFASTDVGLSYLKTKSNVLCLALCLTRVILYILNNLLSKRYAVWVITTLCMFQLQNTTSLYDWMDESLYIECCTDNLCAHVMLIFALIGRMSMYNLL